MVQIPLVPLKSEEDQDGNPRNDCLDDLRSKGRKQIWHGTVLKNGKGTAGVALVPTHRSATWGSTPSLFYSSPELFNLETPLYLLHLDQTQN